MRVFEELRIVNDKNFQMLTNLFDGGIIDEEGNVIAFKTTRRISSNTRLFKDSILPDMIVILHKNWEKLIE